MSRTTVVHLAPKLGGGGAEVSLERLVMWSGWEEIDHLVIQVGGDGVVGARLAERGVEVITVDGSTAALAIRTHRVLDEAVGGRSVAAVHAWMYHAGLVASGLRAIGRLGVPCIVGIRHGDPRDPSMRRRTRGVARLTGLAARHADRVVYNSYSSQTHHLESGFPAHNAQVIPNGFDPGSGIPTDSAKAAARKRFGFPDGVTIVGTLGRLHPVKNHGRFLEVARDICATRSDVVFVACGAGVPSLGITDSVAAALMRRGQLRLLDFVEATRDLLICFDVFCLTSDSESFPNVAAEALLVGVPVVSTDVGDAARIVSDSGWIVDGLDTRGYVAAVERALQMSSAERLGLGERGRSSIVERFSQDTVLAQWADLYGRMSAIRSGSA